MKITECHSLNTDPKRYWMRHKSTGVIVQTNGHPIEMFAHDVERFRKWEKTGNPDPFWSGYVGKVDIVEAVEASYTYKM